MKKGQILALTVFILFISLGMIIVLLMPINQQVIRIREVLSTFEALNNAESGLEVGNLYGIKNVMLPGFNYEISTSSYAGSDCERYFNFIKERYTSIRIYTPQSECSKVIIKDNQNRIESEIYSVLMQSGIIYGSYIKTISNGKERQIERVLDFDFLP